MTSTQSHPVRRKSVAFVLATVFTLHMTWIELLPFYAIAYAQAPASESLELQAEALDDAIYRFSTGDYQGSLDVLEGLIETAEDRDIRIRTKLYAGLNYVMLGDETRANRSFLDVLDLDPSYRLDRSQFSPNLVEAFERARRLLGEQEVITIVSYNEPLIRYSAEAELPEQLAGLPWYKKWWVWGLVGVVVIGGALAATGGDTTSYSPPVVATSFPEPPADFGICLGQGITLAATITGGEPPYMVTWDQVQNYGQANEIRQTSNVDSNVQLEGTLTHTYFPTYNPVDLFDHRDFTLEVTVLDNRQNEGELVRNSQTIRVNNCA